VELVAITRLAFCEFCRDFGAAEDGDYAGGIAIQISPGNGGTNP
jgi:hypothetical protein